MTRRPRLPPAAGRFGDRLRIRIGLIVLAAVAIGAGLYFGWGWLVAAGMAPLLISALPCLAMCALGVCMTGRGNRSWSRQETAGGAPASGTPSVPSGDRAGPLR